MLFIFCVTPFIKALKHNQRAAFFVWSTQVNLHKHSLF